MIPDRVEEEARITRTQDRQPRCPEPPLELPSITARTIYICVHLRSLRPRFSRYLRLPVVCGRSRLSLSQPCTTNWVNPGIDRP